MEKEREREREEVKKERERKEGEKEGRNNVFPFTSVLFHFYLFIFWGAVSLHLHDKSYIKESLLYYLFLYYFQLQTQKSRFGLS